MTLVRKFAITTYENGSIKYLAIFVLKRTYTHQNYERKHYVNKLLRPSGGVVFGAICEWLHATAWFSFHSVFIIFSNEK